MKLADCENSAEIHQQALVAYKAWWQEVKDLPLEKAARVYPLQETDIRWYGGGVDFSQNSHRLGVQCTPSYRSGV